MAISSERIKQDLLKINQLAVVTNGAVKVKSTSGKPINRIILELNYPTAASDNYPAQIQQKTEVKIELLQRYPFVEPRATILSPIYNPNVYYSGKICFGTVWLVTEGLDLLVKRIIQIITFDATIVNTESPANLDALIWYKTAIKAHPNAFPTGKITVKEQPKQKIQWTNLTVDTEKAVINCPKCNASLRIPKNKHLNVTCNQCTYKFLVKT